MFLLLLCYVFDISIYCLLDFSHSFSFSSAVDVSITVDERPGQVDSGVTVVMIAWLRRECFLSDH